MEIAISMDQKSLINELRQGKELANQLKNHLNPCSRNETRQFLVEKILSTYENAISLLNNSTSTVPAPPPSFPNCSESSDLEILTREMIIMKIMPQWTEQVQVCSGDTDIGGSLDDGYGWRKYGQKEILGSKFPRGYYRCRHRHSQGCLATKQVQRSDKDSTILEVSYRGRHTCISTPTSTNKPSKTTPCSPSSFVINSDWKLYNSQQEQKQEQSQEYSILKSTTTKEEIFPSFTFPSAEVADQDINNNLVSNSMQIEGFSPSFMMSHDQYSEFGSLDQYHYVQNSVEYSDLTGEMFSAPTSVNDSPIGDIDFSLVKMEFVPDFSLENPEFFS
ncbi:probable WRKY transcription factor 46 [Rutidosis leptorrhynchoides]|uniref:probable WRKY transcription factor 46 n=1 Tax=Rutidosis leptorrhynchoides TaxID=125765 RepID=UPI003A998E5F